MCVLPSLDMLTIQEITERLRNHYIGGSDGACISASGHKIRHRSEPAHLRTLTSSHEAAYSDVVQQHQESGVDRLPSPRANHAVLLPVPHDICCEDDDEDEYELSVVSRPAATLACSPGACPPSKRHCRSLSIPSDSYTSVDDWLTSSDLPRPVALRPTATAAAAAAAVPTPATFTGGFYAASLSSPVPRPASVASSGFFDGASSSSASSLCWGTGVSNSGGYQPTAAITAAASSDSLAYTAAPRARLLTGDSHYSRHPFNIAGGSKQSVYAAAATAAVSSSTTAACVQSAKSMPSVGSADGIGAFSAPSSPKHRRPQRCRSQPCDLQCDLQTPGGASLKRRREDDRPCLNFAKMTETAYERLSSERFWRFKGNAMTACKLAGIHYSTNHDSLHSSAAAVAAAAGGMYAHRLPAQPSAESETTYQPLQTIACSPPEGCVAWVVDPSSVDETVPFACSRELHTVSSENDHGCSLLAGGSCEKSSFDCGEAEFQDRGDSDEEYDCDGGSSSSSSGGGGSSAESEYVDALGEPLISCCISPSADDLDLDEIELH